MYYIYTALLRVQKNLLIILFSKKKPVLNSFPNIVVTVCTNSSGKTFICPKPNKRPASTLMRGCAEYLDIYDFDSGPALIPPGQKWCDAYKVHGEGKNSFISLVLCYFFNRQFVRVMLDLLVWNTNCLAPFLY